MQPLTLDAAIALLTRAREAIGHNVDLTVEGNGFAQQLEASVQIASTGNGEGVTAMLTWGRHGATEVDPGPVFTLVPGGSHQR